MAAEHGFPLALRAANLDSIGFAANAAAATGVPVSVPTYDRSTLRPSIVHIGVGGFHRAHLAQYVHQLCEAGEVGWSIVGAGILPGDSAMADALHRQDHLYTLVVRDVGDVSGEVVGSIVDYLHAHPDPGDLIDRIAHPDTQIVSLTITEGGYPVDDRTGVYDASSPVAGDGSAFDIIARGLAARRAAGVGPLTVLSCDNVVGNGSMTRTATVGEAARIDADLAAWIDETVAFPNSMVDRITPATTDDDRRWLAGAAGIDDRWPVFTEPFSLWVLEDRFAGERPPVEHLDVVITDDVEPFEQMKLRLLNAGHSTLAYLSALIGHTHVHDAMADPAIRDFLDGFLRREARPVLPPVPGYDVDDFQDGLVERFANPAIGDQIGRLCLDGSVKFPKFLVPTIQAQLAAGGPVELSALAIAGWCRYLLGGTAEDGSTIAVAADPSRDEAMARAAAAEVEPASFLGWPAVFGESLSADERFVSAFVDAVVRLRRDGVVPSIGASLVR
ncbi:MAG: mannitol dehydrogenase family protein [Actinomycetota bacterium]